jgi:mono/diheme cytochrome c family protein
MHGRMIRIVIIYLACIALASCARQVMTVSRSPNPIDSLANGRSIFQTGRDVAGVQIAARTAPRFGKCSACHRADGSGGVHLAGGAVSADLRYPALVQDQRHPYNLRLLERAISTGVDNDAHQLDSVMPRWRLSQRDLHDVAQYVLTQLK